MKLFKYSLNNNITLIQRNKISKIYNKYEIELNFKLNLLMNRKKKEFLIVFNQSLKFEQK